MKAVWQCDPMTAEQMKEHKDDLYSPKETRL
jgi:hypothetical protein